MITLLLIDALGVLMIETRQIKNFLALAEHLHFGKAANAVNLTQPSLSRQLSALEEQLGCTLVARTSRAVELTAAGKEFQRLANGLMSGLEDAVRTTHAVARGLQGELTIGFTSYMAWTILPGIAKTYFERYPDVQVHLNEMLPVDLNAMVRSGGVDIGVTFESLDDLLRYQPLHSEPLCIALPADHELSAQPNVSIKSLEGSRFILSPRETFPPLYDSIMHACHQAGFSPQDIIHTNLQQSIINLVAVGLGVAIVPQSMSKFSHPGITYRPIASSPHVRCGICWSPANENPCLQNLLSLFPPTR